jgi:hypothetical protein
VRPGSPLRSSAAVLPRCLLSYPAKCAITLKSRGLSRIRAMQTGKPKIFYRESHASGPLHSHRQRDETVAPPAHWDFSGIPERKVRAGGRGRSEDEDRPSLRKGNSLIEQSEPCTLDIEGVHECRNRTHPGNVGQFITMPAVARGGWTAHSRRTAAPCEILLRARILHTTALSSQVARPHRLCEFDFRDVHLP